MRVAAIRSSAANLRSAYHYRIVLEFHRKRCTAGAAQLCLRVIHHDKCWPDHLFLIIKFTALHHIQRCGINHHFHTILLNHTAWHTYTQTGKTFFVSHSLPTLELYITHESKMLLELSSEEHWTASFTQAGKGWMRDCAHEFVVLMGHDHLQGIFQTLYHCQGLYDHNTLQQPWSKKLSSTCESIVYSTVPIFLVDLWVHCKLVLPTRATTAIHRYTQNLIVCWDFLQLLHKCSQNKRW